MILHRKYQFTKIQVLIFSILILGLLFSCKEKKKYTSKFTISAGSAALVQTPISLETKLEEGLNIYKRREEELLLVPTQWDGTTQWLLPEVNDDDTISQEYWVKKKSEDISNNSIKVVKTEKEYRLSYNDAPLLSYRYQLKYPPNGIDSIYAKSGYIHPLLSPSGDTLTRIQPPDHYHHYGLWGPWTKTTINGRGVDFWNLAEGEGTVLFKKLLATYEGPLFSGIKVRQEHLDLKAPEDNKVAIIEDLDIKAWRLNNDNDRYIVDYVSSFTTPLAEGILLEAYRYGGGLGFRFTERWEASNSTVLTSEGKGRLDADGTSARWCIISGTSSDGQSSNGVLFLSHTDNQSHPEPMRIWPMDANNGRGDVFFEFCPIRHKKWVLERDKEYTLNYRLVVFEGNITPEEAEAYWQSYVNPVSVKINFN